MQTSKTRLMAISGATLALIVTGTAAVSAHPGDRDDQRGPGKGRAGAQFKQRLDRDMGGLGAFGLRGGLRAGLADRLDDFSRRETSVVTVDGSVVHRVDNGTADSASDAGLDYTLTNGETASVTTDEDTQVIAFSEQTIEVGRRGITRERMVPETIDLTDIEAGTDVLVWAQSEDGETFLAQRIVVQPAMDEEADEMTDEAEAEPATEEAESEEAAAAPATDA